MIIQSRIRRVLASVLRTAAAGLVSVLCGGLSLLPSGGTGPACYGSTRLRCGFDKAKQSWSGQFQDVSVPGRARG
jgi:hypothetical protein